MKDVEFLGDSLEAVRSFPTAAKRSVGFQIDRLQNGLEPDDWKPMKTIGQGVREVRIREAKSAYRIVYIATLSDAVFILHAFEKKTRATPQKDLALATTRLKMLMKQRAEGKV
jgi:phage-related protein